MTNFSLYEQSAIIVPGAVLAFGAALLFPQLRSLFADNGLTLGDLGVFLLVAYAGGHLVAAPGNLLETVWWSACGGMPSNWVAQDPPKLLSAAQVALPTRQIDTRLGLNVGPIKGLSRKEWKLVFRQLYRDVLANNPGRVDAFNGSYGLNRGLAAALLCLALGFLIFLTPARWDLASVLALAGAVYLYRMHRFGVHFAREVLLGFLNSK